MSGRKFRDVLPGKCRTNQARLNVNIGKDFRKRKRHNPEERPYESNRDCWGWGGSTGSSFGGGGLPREGRDGVRTTEVEVQTEGV